MDFTNGVQQRREVGTRRQPGQHGARATRGQPSISRNLDAAYELRQVVNGHCDCGALKGAEASSMASTNRLDVLAEGEIQVVHCVNRWVRRAFFVAANRSPGSILNIGENSSGSA